GRPGAAELDVPGAHARGVLHCQLDHAEAMAGGDDALGLLVRRHRGGDQPDLVQALGLPHLLGRPQMPQMNPVEGAAQTPDPADPALPIRHYPRTWPSPRTRYL